MAERIPRPVLADDIAWPSGSNPWTDPGAVLRAAGWAYKAKPAAAEFNWIQKLVGEILLWRDAFVPREWTELSEGIANTVHRALFRVVPGSGGIAARFTELFDVTGTATGGGWVKGLCTDGEQLYYFSGDALKSVVAASPVDGSEIWEAVLGAEITAITVDGSSVYRTHDATQVGLRKLNRENGGTEGSGGTTFGCSILRANGVYCVGLKAGNATFWTVAIPTETGTVNPTTLLVALGIDADRCYVGGTRNTRDVWAYNLSDRSLAWQTVLDSNEPTVRAICADGDCVYVVTNSRSLTAGGTANLWCLSRYDGVLLWTLNVKNATVDLIDCAVDDRYLYVLDDTATLLQIRLRASVPVVVAELGNVDTVACDGVSVVSRVNSEPGDFKRHLVGGATRTLMHADGNDPNRRPFYTLAVPTDGRI